MSEDFNNNIVSPCLLLIVMGFGIYFIVCAVNKDAGKGLSHFIADAFGVTIKVAFHIMRVLLMLTINLFTLILRIITKLTDAGVAWAVFIERMSEVLLDF